MTAKHLWDFSFDELFAAENGQTLLVEATKEEKAIVKELSTYYEEMAARCRAYLLDSSKAELVNRLPQLMRFDVMLQLCLIHSLAVHETIFQAEEILELINQEAVDYFYEYRSFRPSYSFEKYSIMNQIAAA